MINGILQKNANNVAILPARLFDDQHLPTRFNPEDLLPRGYALTEDSIFNHNDPTVTLLAGKLTLEDGFGSQTIVLRSGTGEFGEPKSVITFYEGHDDTLELPPRDQFIVSEWEFIDHEGVAVEDARIEDISRDLVYDPPNDLYGAQWSAESTKSFLLASKSTYIR